MIQCIIVDDQPLSRQLLELHVRRHSSLQLVDVCSNASEAFDTIHTKQPDLIFLDIQMPAITGIQFIKSLKAAPAFIFVTAFPDYAVLSYELNAVDYLLKPVTYERFCIAIEKFQKLKPVASTQEYTYFKIDGSLVKLMHHDIIYAQSIRDYLIIVTTRGKYITHMTMKYLAELLPSRHFIRVHRSYLVNIGRISSFNRDAVNMGSIIIPLGESYRNALGSISK